MGVSFPQPKSVGPREWGEEILLLLVSKKFSLKRIKMHKGAKGGLQYHHLKDEGGVMLSGEMVIRYDVEGLLNSRTVREGDVFHFPPKSVHQAEAITEVEYIEVSTPHFNDRVHVEKSYGLEDEAGGLPSTKLHEVELL